MTINCPQYYYHPPHLYFVPIYVRLIRNKIVVSRIIRWNEAIAMQIPKLNMDNRNSAANLIPRNVLTSWEWKRVYGNGKLLRYAYAFFITLKMVKYICIYLYMYICIYKYIITKELSLYSYDKYYGWPAFGETYIRPFMYLP